MFHNTNKNKILIGIIVLLVVIFGLVLFFLLKKPVVKEVKNDYSIVYLTTGEVYIGKLSVFPQLRLKNSYILAIGKDATDPTKNTFQLNPLKDTLWAPKYINLNRDQVVFYGPLEDTSSIAQKLAEQVKN